MNQIKIILVAAVTVVLVAGLSESCSYKKDSLLSKPCDTTKAVTYKLTVEPVIKSNCITCHNDADRPGNLTYETYEGVRDVALSGRLVGAISHTPGFLEMPLGGTKLDPCIIEDIKRWVQQGALNN